MKEKRIRINKLEDFEPYMLYDIVAFDPGMEPGSYPSIGDIFFKDEEGTFYLYGFDDASPVTDDGVSLPYWRTLDEAELEYDFTKVTNHGILIKMGNMLDDTREIRRLMLLFPPD